MKFIDTHSHPTIIKDFYKKKNNIDLDYSDLFDVFKKKDICKVICVSTNKSDFDQNIQLSYLSDICFFSLGIHPCDVINIEVSKEEIFCLKEKVLFSQKNNLKLVAIGETGIDLYHSSENLSLQKAIFEEQIKIAIEGNLPLIIHSRNAFNETYDILKYYKIKNNITAVIHCFSDDYETAKKWVDLDFFLGIGGIITYPKNNALREGLFKIGFENIVLETDAPFLPIQEFRGKINTSEFIPDINLYLSSIYKINEEILAEKIYNSTMKIVPRLLNE
jgi:TatD DNase family protein